MEPKTLDLVYWITERWAIKQRREAGMPPPWTADPIMATTRWCNVHREDDYTTQWMRQSWSNAQSPMWWFVLGRMINYVPTLDSITGIIQYPEKLGFVEHDQHNFRAPTLQEIKKALKEMRASGEKVFTSAYTISTCGKSMDKIDYVVDHVCAEVKALEDDIDQVWFRKEHDLTTTFLTLTSIDGLGSFLAAQVLADCKNTPGHPLQTAPDWWTFSAPGPGSLRGLSWFWNNSPQGITGKDYKLYLKRTRDLVDPILIECHPDIPRLCDQDFQNCLCEFSKYMKQKVDPNAHIRNRYVTR